MVTRTSCCLSIEAKATVNVIHVSAPRKFPKGSGRAIADVIISLSHHHIKKLVPWT
jgi:hypothetical protein